MKFIYILFLFLFTLAPVFARDVINLKTGAVEGKVTALSDGLIQYKTGGVEFSVTRAKDGNFFGDYIKYIDRPYYGSTVEANCRVTFVDMFNVSFETPEAKVKVPRYRVKAMLINAN